jgi:D-alanine-D-alanine ligase
MGKIKVAIIYGGRSVEHDISLLSAKNILDNIDREKFEVTLIGINKKGSWFLLDNFNEPISSGSPLSLQLDAQNPAFICAETQITPDVVFPVLHGTDGEDGSIQGLLQTFRIPFVGSGVLGSSASMDKLLAKRVMASAGLPVAKFIDLGLNEWQSIQYAAVVAELGLPLIVKPVNLGSSVGVSKVSNESEFITALEDAFRYDNSLLIEEFIEAREVECAIIGNEKALASVAGEVVLSTNYDFYSFVAKYKDANSAKIAIPAEMPEETHARIKELSLKAYKLLNCKDLSRVDLFVRDNGDVFINEINTIPGFTNISMFPSLMKHEGIEYTTLITKLLDLAMERFQKENRISTEYDSEL